MRAGDEVAELGYRILLLPISLLLAATGAMQATLAAIRQTGTTGLDAFGPDPFSQFNSTIGLPELLAAETRYVEP